MKYFLIAGEASGDLHGSNLISEIKLQDPTAEFCCFGGDLMEAQGAIVLKHYREMAFMGLIPVLLNLKTILRNMRLCQKEILKYKPDVLILIDYPGFNLKIAKYIKNNSKVPIFYYISPKVWAWKEYRVKSFKKYVDEMFSILPFEVDFYKKHKYNIHYVGNPTVDSVANFREKNISDTRDRFIIDNKLDNLPIIALLAGSRIQEIKDNLPSMLASIKGFEGHQVVIAAAPSIEKEYYDGFIAGSNCHIVFDQTYRVLNYADVALVTSGTATLETALFKVPQVVCYKTPIPHIVYWVFKNLLTTPYISLVNLIVNKPVVQELFAKFFSVDSIKDEVNKLVYDLEYRNNMLSDYDEVIAVLGLPGASKKAAGEIIDCLSEQE